MKLSPMRLAQGAALVVTALTVLQACTVVVDAMSLQYLMGAEIDYEDKLDGARFVIRNPNASSTCGCSVPLLLDQEASASRVAGQLAPVPWTLSWYQSMSAREARSSSPRRRSARSTRVARVSSAAVTPRAYRRDAASHLYGLNPQRISVQV